MSLATLAFVSTAASYLVACGFFSAHLRDGSERAAFWATRSLGVSIGLHVIFVSIDYVTSGRAPLGSMHQTLALLSLLIAVGFLSTMRRHRLPVLGAFITPVTLLLFLGAGFQGAAPGVPESVRSALLPVHIVVNVLGLAAFALAFGAAVAYLMQEQLLRRRQLSGAFQRLPALDVLDAIGFRLVTVGFTLFTFGVVTGTVWASRAGMSFSAGQGFALFSWLCFAVVLLSRVAGGWRGRRAAIGTMLGFLGAMAAVGGYLLRGVGG